MISGLYEGWVEAASRNLLPHREIGYTVLGPALTGFARYLQATDLSGRNRYTFLAREGLIFQRAYEAMHPESRDRSHYLRISTRAIGSALLTARLDDSDLRFLTKTPISLRASEYVTRIVPELGPDETDAILRKFDVGATDRMSSLEARARLQPVFAYLSDELAQVGERSRAALAHYLHPLALEHDDVRIVDIGWSGTIQAGLERLLEVALQGSYFALVDVARTRSNDRMHAWADARRGGSLAMLVQTMYRNVQPLEVLAAEASVGSLASVSEGADGEPVLGFLPREFPPVDVAVIDDIQDAALEFVRDFSEYVTGRSLPIDLLDPRTALEPLRMLLTKPSAAQAGVLSNVHFDGSYGTRARKVGSWWYPPRVRRWR